MKIIYFIHGRGRGHSSRALSILPRLIEQGYELEVYAGRDAFPALEHFENVHPIESIMPSSSPWRFIKRIFQDRKLLKKTRPDVLISDGDAPCTYAAKLLGIHVISIGHAIIFPHCRHPFPLDKKGLRLEKFKVAMATSAADARFAVHFTSILPKTKHTYVVRPDFQFADQPKIEDYVLSYFRDGNGKEVLEELVRLGIKIKNFGTPIDILGVENYPIDQASFREAQGKASGVVASAGSNLIYESILMKKPMLLLYLQSDFEQRTNVQYVEYENLGFGMPVEALQKEKIDRFVKALNQPISGADTLKDIPVLSDELMKYLSRL